MGEAVEGNGCSGGGSNRQLQRLAAFPISEGLPGIGQPRRAPVGARAAVDDSRRSRGRGEDEILLKGDQMRTGAGTAYGDDLGVQRFPSVELLTG